MASSRNKSKSFGLRMLWIPGKPKHHPKGRLDTTNKPIAYSARQKKSEVWSMGGSEAQKELIYAEPDSVLLEGPSGSGIKAVTCTLGVIGITQCTQTLPINEDVVGDDRLNKSNIQQEKLPEIPTSEGITLTAPIVSLPENLEGDLIMPAKTTVHTHTTTAEISDENRFAILAKTLPEDAGAYAVTYEDTNGLNNSSGTNGSNESTASTSSKARSTTEKSRSSSASSSPKKKKHHRNHNNNHRQKDANSINHIESIEDDIPSDDFDWIDDIGKSDSIDKDQLSHSSEVEMRKKSRPVSAKNLDQPDGVPNKTKSESGASEEVEDDKVVKCLYYTLMCCECTIS